jgi:Family of unknown function (DUF6084)
MTDCRFAVTAARAERHAVAPTLTFGLRIDVDADAIVHAIALRVQLQIDPRQRRHTASEADRLYELFGESTRWRETVRPLLWTHTSVLVPGFTASADVDVPVACTYDFEVAAAKYFHALDDGEIPLLFLFSGTIFLASDRGFSVAQVPWDREAPYRLPVALWREMMDHHFPNSAWIRLRRESFDALHRFKGRRALPTWDDAVEALLAQAETPERV